MDDFSTNRHAETALKPDAMTISSPPCRHPDLWFTDGNVVLVAGGFYFNVHRGVLCRQSVPLSEALTALANDPSSNSSIEGNPVLKLADNALDLSRFLTAMYDGVSDLKHDHLDFDIVSSLLRLSTKYRVERIRKDVLRGMAVIWPKTLQAWEFREADATDPTGLYKPRSVYPHPILVIKLARETGALELLPSAFYDLARCAASEIATGYLPPNATDYSESQHLSEEDLLVVLKGREHASRFLSTFVVSELEGRDNSVNCLHRNDPDLLRRRVCQATFEATTFEILRDVNGVAFQRSSDPLFAMMDADMMQARPGADGGRLSVLHRACEPCRHDFSAVVDAARDTFWRKLPGWFGVNVPGWP